MFKVLSYGRVATFSLTKIRIFLIYPKHFMCDHNNYDCVFYWCVCKWTSSGRSWSFASKLSKFEGFPFLSYLVAPPICSNSPKLIRVVADCLWNHVNGFYLACWGLGSGCWSLQLVASGQTPYVVVLNSLALSHWFLVYLRGRRTPLVRYFLLSALKQQQHDPIASVDLVLRGVMTLKRRLM